jgi:hypothetical protein
VAQEDSIGSCLKLTKRSRKATTKVPFRRFPELRENY